MNYISDTAHISHLADLEFSQRGSSLIIGDNSQIDSFVKIKFSGGTGDVVIGAHCYINSGTVVYSGNGIKLGDFVLIAANCTLAPVNHAYKEKDTTILEQRFAPSKGGIVIGNDVWIGANTVILDGAVIPDGCVIGAQSLVKGKLESYGIYVGSPAKLVGYRIPRKTAV